MLMGRTNREYRVIVYGLGAQYNKNFNIIKYYELSGQFSVVGVTAKWIPDSLYLDGYRLFNKNELHEILYDYIIVMSDQYFKDIVIDLVNDGIERKRILNYRVLQIPHLDFHTYIEFKNSNISILSNNCWGGAICFTLGIECLSPCKNLFFEDDDYIKFLQNLKYYIRMRNEVFGICFRA